MVWWSLIVLFLSDCYLIELLRVLSESSWSFLTLTPPSPHSHLNLTLPSPHSHHLTRARMRLVTLRQTYAKKLRLFPLKLRLFHDRMIPLAPVRAKNPTPYAWEVLTILLLTTPNCFLLASCSVQCPMLQSASHQEMRSPACSKSCRDHICCKFLIKSCFALVINVYRNLGTMDTVLHTRISLIVPAHWLGHS